MKARVKLGQGVTALFGPLDENVKLLEKVLKVSIHLTEDALEVEGEPDGVEPAKRFIEEFEELSRRGAELPSGDVKSFLRVLKEDPKASLLDYYSPRRAAVHGKKHVMPKSVNQRHYLMAIAEHDMVFGIGPSGTGKTYLAVATAVESLLSKEVSRIILARPAVEAGERLGFLPGTLQQKIDPYLRPLYDALYDVLDPDRVERYIEKGIIEIAPLAFMRGRTLNDAFVILDEAQNTTSEQMKMFLTRLGFNSKAVITGDVTQIDLPDGRRSGLVETLDIVAKVKGIAFVHFNEKDVVRHNLVQQIVRAYEEFNQNRSTEGVRKKA